MAMKRKRKLPGTAARERALRVLARREVSIIEDFIRLRSLVGLTVQLYREGSVKESHRTAKQMLDLEYELLGDCESTACVAQVVGLPES